jgi:hypothetical protein
MKPRIATWFDNDVALLSFEVCDGNSLFSNEAYAELDWGTKAATALARFGHQIHGGLFNLETVMAVLNMPAERFVPAFTSTSRPCC